MEEFNDIPQFGFVVSDYSCVGDPNDYSNHIFNVQVWIGQEMYVVERSYSSFCELDARIRRKYPRSAIPTLPLAGSNLFSSTPNLIKRNMSNYSNKRLDQSGNRSISINYTNPLEVGSLVKDKLMNTIVRSHEKRVEYNEIIAQKKVPLNQYLSSILALPELMISEEILLFFDAESQNGDSILEITNEKTEIDILLQNEVPSSRTVMGQLTLPMNLDPGTNCTHIIIPYNFQYFKNRFYNKNL
jgi:hypothetical protein